MATKWSYGFFTDTTNAMSIEERIKETVANFGNGDVIFPDGECCSTEEELRSLLVKKKILGNHKNANNGGWIGKITKAIILFVVCSLYVACSPQGNTTDVAVQKYKVWNYKTIDNTYQAELYSKNYYSTDKDENVYLIITVIKDRYSEGVFLGMDVHGTHPNETKTVLRFLPNVDHAILSFDNGNLELWNGKASDSGYMFLLGSAEEIIKKIKASNSCTIKIETEIGEMTCAFDTKDLHWD